MLRHDPADGQPHDNFPMLWCAVELCHPVASVTLILEDPRCNVSMHLQRSQLEHEEVLLDASTQCLPRIGAKGGITQLEHTKQAAGRWSRAAWPP